MYAPASITHTSTQKMGYEILTSERQMHLRKVLLCPHTYIHILRKKHLKCSRATTKVVSLSCEVRPGAFQYL